MPNVEISENAYKYLQDRAKPLVDTTISVFDRIIAENKKLFIMEKEAGMDMHFGIADIPSVKFSVIKRAMIAEQPLPKKSWNHALEKIISVAAKIDDSSQQLQELLQAKTKTGKHENNGYRYVPDANFSFQGMEANRACRNIFLLAEQFSIKVSLSIQWESNAKAAHPGSTAELKFP